MLPRLVPWMPSRSEFTSGRTASQGLATVAELVLAFVRGLGGET